MVERLQPHTLTVLSVKNSNGETLLFKRAFQPYINRWGYPLGKTHFNETIDQAAERELLEKTGLTGVRLTQRGIVYLTVVHDESVITKALCHVFSATASVEQKLMASSHRGFCGWMNTEKLNPAELMPGFIEVQELLDSEEPAFFFSEISAVY